MVNNYEEFHITYSSWHWVLTPFLKNVITMPVQYNYLLSQERCHVVCACMCVSVCWCKLVLLVGVVRLQKYILLWLLFCRSYLFACTLRNSVLADYDGDD